MCTHEGCGKRFSQEGNLQKHRNLHQNIRPHACPDPNCDAAFVQKVHLDYHTQQYHTATGQRRQKKEEQRVEAALLATKVYKLRLYKK